MPRQITTTRHRHGPEPRPLAERFWEKVDTSGGPLECWPWTAARFEKGYGAFRDGQRQRKAHRVAYELTYGTIDAGEQVNHHCDNPPCCNPAHLYTGDQLQNRRDAVQRGRTATGDRNGSRTQPERLKRGEQISFSKLTETGVREIRRLVAEGLTDTDLGRRFGVSRVTIAAIRNRETWVHVL